MRRALGKGLSQLIADQLDPTSNEIPVERVRPNPQQPRTHFDEESIAELADSIREFGVLQPIIVRSLASGDYELIAGERRLRAAKKAGLETIPALVRQAGNQSSLEMAVVENIQREDINVLERARAYRRLMDEFRLTQEQVAEKVAKSRVVVANTVRLLRLPKRIQEGIEENRISEGHARALLAFDSEAQQLAVYDQIIERGLTVREVEKAAKPRESKQITPRQEDRDPNDSNLEEALSTYFGSPTRIHRGPAGGKIQIEFYSDEDLQRMLDILGFSL